MLSDVADSFSRDAWVFEFRNTPLKASILAFESYRRKEQLDFLENLTDEDIDPVLKVFDDIDDLQLSYYGQIVKLRLGVITALQEKLDRDDKETVIRDQVFDHLWLLDPSWVRVKGSEVAEKNHLEIFGYFANSVESMFFVYPSLPMPARLAAEIRGHFRSGILPFPGFSVMNFAMVGKAGIGNLRAYRYAIMRDRRPERPSRAPGFAVPHPSA